MHARVRDRNGLRARFAGSPCSGQSINSPGPPQNHWRTRKSSERRVRSDLGAQKGAPRIAPKQGDPGLCARKSIGDGAQHPGAPISTKETQSNKRVAENGWRSASPRSIFRWPSDRSGWPSNSYRLLGMLSLPTQAFVPPAMQSLKTPMERQSLHSNHGPKPGPNFDFLNFGAFRTTGHPTMA